MNNYSTEQEKFWSGEFGDTYVKRVNNKDLINANEALFLKIFKKLPNNIESVLEFGSNIGLNLRAIQRIEPDIELSAIEINAKAVQALEELNLKKIYKQSLFDFHTDYKRDMVFIKGVLIHLAPDKLKEAYRKIYESSKKYILVVEYYSTTPIALEYRGHENKLFKRDFAGEILDLYDDVKLVDYGFIYRRDAKNPMDDLSWFLMEKNSGK